jgi:hypothetical protein
MMSSLCAQLRESSRVPSLGALLVLCSSSRQAALDAVSCLLAEKLKNDQFTSFRYETIGGRNILLKRTRNPTWAKNPPTQNNCLPSQRNDHTCSSLRRWSPTHKRFLHACTPARLHACTPALVGLFTQREHGHRPDTTKHILQKNLQGAETLGNNSSGAASEPHRFKYILVGRSVGLEMTLLR